MDTLRATIAALEAQRAVLGDAVVDTALGPLREKLASLEPAPAERRFQRRQVTVLFADIMGYTSLSEEVDPERLGQMLTRFWGGVDALVQSHRGQVFSHMGDGIMAVWGGAASAEDDAEQAIRVGLAMLETIRTDGLVLAGVRVEAQMRVGVNTGLAHVSDRDGRTATGDTVNVAARLEGAAEPGTLLISRSTYAQVRGLFEVVDAGQRALKGRAQPVHAFRVVRPLPRAFPARRRGIEGVETDLVGRSAALGQIRGRLLQSAEHGRPCMVSLVGEPGIGKSRLLAECRDVIDTAIGPSSGFEGRCHPDSEPQPFALLRSVLSHRFLVSDDDDPDTATRKVAAGVGDMVGSGAERIAESLAWLIGVAGRSTEGFRPESTYRRNAALSDVIDFFTQVAAGGLPVVLLLEDLHWADAASLELLERLLAAAPRGVSMIGTMRPALAARRPAWTTSRGLHPDHVAMPLEPLDDAAASRLVDLLLCRADEIPAGFREHLVARAGGNPFHLEELVRMLIDDGVIATGETWTIDAGRVADGRVPDTLVGVLQSRLDRLGATEFRLLQVASVFGRVFWDQALPALAPPSPAGAPARGDVAGPLAALAAAELVQRSPTSRFSGAAEWQFRHDVLRSVVYDTLPLDDRPRLHRGAAAWLEPAAGARGDEYAVVIAGHLDKAGDAARAADWYIRAARQAAGQALFTDALRLYGEAVSRIDDPVRRTDVLLGQTYAMVTSGRHDDAKRLVEPILAPGSGASVSQQLRARAELARIYGLRDGNFDAAERLLLDGIAQQHEVPEDDPSRHLLEHQLGILQILVGRYTDAVATLRGAIEHLSPRVDPQRRGWTINALAHAHAHLGDRERSVALSHEAERIAREHNDPRLVMAAIAQRARAALQADDWTVAAELFEEAQLLNRRHGDVEKLATVANYQGHAALGLGDVGRARAHFEEAAEVAERAGVVTERVRAAVGLAAVVAHHGAHACARQVLASARAHPAAGGEVTLLAAWVEARHALTPTTPDGGPSVGGHDVDAWFRRLREHLDPAVASRSPVPEDAP